MLFITACDRQPVITVEPEGSRQGIIPIIVIDGRLKFSDSKAFGKTVSELNKTVNFDQWEQQFEGFTSLRSAYRRINLEEVANNAASLKALEAVMIKEQSSDGDSFERSIVDPLLATLVNEKGLLQVGDSLYKISDKQVRKTHVKNIDEIDNLNSRQVIVKKPSKYGLSKGGRIAGTKEIDEYEYVTYYADGRQHRYKSNGWAVNYWFENYRSTGIRVTHQRKVTFGWSWSNAFDWSASGYWYITSNTTPPIAIVSLPVLSASISYESDEFVPYYYSETPPGLSARVYAYCSWHSRGRDGVDHYWAHYIDTDF